MKPNICFLLSVLSVAMQSQQFISLLLTRTPETAFEPRVVDFIGLCFSVIVLS